jgi:hypothetical protein
MNFKMQSKGESTTRQNLKYSTIPTRSKSYEYLRNSAATLPNGIKRSQQTTMQILKIIVLQKTNQVTIAIYRGPWLLTPYRSQGQPEPEPARAKLSQSRARAEPEQSQCVKIKKQTDTNTTPTKTPSVVETAYPPCKNCRSTKHETTKCPANATTVVTMERSITTVNQNAPPVIGKSIDWRRRLDKPPRKPHT